MDNKITWSWCIVSSRHGSIKISANETPSGAEYLVTNSGCPVRSDDLQYVLNKAIPFCCPHTGEMIKPVRKGLVPAGVSLPEPIIKEKKVVEPIKVEEPVKIDEPVKEIEEETPDEFDGRKRYKKELI